MNIKRISDCKEIYIIDGDRGKNYPSKNELLKKGYCLFLNAGNVTKKGFEFYNNNFISKEKDSLLRKGKLKCNDIVLTTRGTVGNVAFYEDKIKYKNLRINSGMVIIRTIGSCFYPKFLYYNLISDFVQLQMETIKTGSAQPQLPITLINQLKIYTTNLIEQKAIADVLSSFDDKIELNNKIIKNLEEQAQSLYKHWFIDFEFPDENGKPYKSNGGKFKQSELGLIPEGWNCLQIYDVCKRITKKVSKNKYEVLSAINSGELIPSKEYFDKQVFSQNIERYICVEPNCFAYNPARANIGSIGMNKFNYIGCVSPVYVVVKFEDFYEWFWEYTIKNENFKEIIKLRSSGSVRQNFDFNSFASIKIIYPSKKSVVDFNNQFLNINAKLEQLKTENQKLIETRDYLLPKLISGEVKVTDIK